ncbi:MAG: hydrogenase maturation nickel metallochaperone HypA [Pseudomonadota bacterium]
MSIAVSIVELVSEKAQAAGARKVTTIELEVGRLSGLMAEALAFCFEAVARNTPAEGAELLIREIDGCGSCLACGHSFLVDSLLAQCPQCGGYAVETIQGRELKVISLTVDE